MAQVSLERRPSHRLFENVVTFATYLYLLRVPLLIGLFLLFLPVVALWQGSPLVSLLQNLFWLTPENTFWCTVAALELSWSLLLTVRLILLNGADRFGVPQGISAAKLTRRQFFVVVVVVLPLLVGPFTQYRDFDYKFPDLALRLTAVVGGFVAAYVLAFIALYAAVLLSPKGTQDLIHTFPVLPFMRRWLPWANDRDILPEWSSKLARWFRDYFPYGLWAGYLNPHNGLLWPGHWLALLFCLATVTLYVGIDLYRQTYLGETTPVPALAFLLLLFLNLNWILSVLAFFLDRYRIPLIVPIFILCVLGSHAPSSDHYYMVQHGVSIQPVHPHQVLSTRIQNKTPIVLIATAGGGIQAAAWTTQVLSGIESQTQTWGVSSFAKSVTLISAVSGGAVGSMYYLNLFHPEGENVFDREKLNSLTRKAAASSLDDIAWALVYRDLSRSFFPYVKLSSEQKVFDRGYILEESWRNRDNIHANLSNWRVGVVEGLRPAVIFNSTIAETGEPLLLGTTEMQADVNNFHRRSFYELYPNTDVSVVTAVRLASTFPYVTPAARALSTKPEYHIVDGGYYDNYGISSLVAWLDSAFHGLQREKKPLPPVLVIQIRSFPDDAVAAPTNKGWFFQSYAPLNGLLSVRTTGQLVRGREELSLFAEKWARFGAVRIHMATFEFRGHNAPLSWSMNPSQEAEITRQWNQVAVATNPDLLVVHCFFDPNYDGCYQNDGSR